MRRNRTLLTAALAVGAVVGLAAPAQAAGPPMTRTCGWATCSVYYSHATTVEIDNYLNRNDVQQVELMKKLLCGRFSKVGSISCKALKFGDWNVRRIIHQAATTNGCVRFRTARGFDNSPGPVYNDHSQTCRSMD